MPQSKLSNIKNQTLNQKQLFFVKFDLERFTCEWKSFLTNQNLPKGTYALNIKQRRYSEKLISRCLGGGTSLGFFVGLSKLGSTLKLAWGSKNISGSNIKQN